jgi:SpoIID/LytB domain protein
VRTAALAFVAAAVLGPTVGLPLGVATTPAHAATADTATAVSSHDGSGEPQAVRTGGPVVASAADGALIDVGGTRHLDTVEVHPSGDDGLLVINDLGVEDYLLGIAEMPGRWPLEALKAQAVAARTYAWFVREQGTYPGYDICASTACQVFRGAETVLEEAGGRRWRQAVEETAGQVLVTDDGAPILARYFSTSGGRTYANEEVFPSSGPRPYLVAIDDPDDEASPYHRWTATFTREQFDALLARGETLAAAVPVAEVERLGDVDDPGARVRVTGQDGTEVEVGAVALRDFLSRVAPDAYPDEFPQARADGLRPLPDAVPSGRYDVEVDDTEVVLHGRGWGHGVGMGQYGARGRAERGEDHQDILAAYYGGLRPTTADELPDRIRVGREVGGEVTLRASGATRLQVGDTDVVADPALGTWTVRRDGDELVVSPPAGHDAELAVAATRPAAGVPTQPDAVTVETEVNKPVLLHLEVTDADGDAVVSRDLGTADPGVHAATWRFDDADGDPVPEGTYRVALVGEDGTGRGGDPLDVEVAAPTTRTVVGVADDLGIASPRAVALLAGGVALAAAVVLLVARRRPD